MRTSPITGRFVLSLLALALTARTTTGAIIYEARSASPNSLFLITDLNEPSSFVEFPGQFNEFDSRVADSITFAGTDRFVTGFTTRVVAFGGTARGYTLDVELSLYENAGGLPGALIWSGVTPGVSVQGGSGTTSVEVSFTPNVLVPDSVCFAFGFTTQVTAMGETRTVGIATTGNNPIGSSPATILFQASDTGAWRIEDFSASSGGLFRHVDARVEAIPAPTAGLALTALALAAQPRRRHPR